MMTPATVKSLNRSIAFASLSRRVIPSATTRNIRIGSRCHDQRLVRAHNGRQVDDDQSARRAPSDVLEQFIQSRRRQELRGALGRRGHAGDNQIFDVGLVQHLLWCQCARKVLRQLVDRPAANPLKHAWMAHVEIQQVDHPLLLPRDADREVDRGHRLAFAWPGARDADAGPVPGPHSVQDPTAHQPKGCCGVARSRQLLVGDEHIVSARMPPGRIRFARAAPYANGRAPARAAPAHGRPRAKPCRPVIRAPAHRATVRLPSRVLRSCFARSSAS